jgi:hypothetical protein
MDARLRGHDAHRRELARTFAPVTVKGLKKRMRTMFSRNLRLAAPGMSS